MSRKAVCPLLLDKALFWTADPRCTEGMALPDFDDSPEDFFPRPKTRTTPPVELEGNCTAESFLDAFDRRPRDLKKGEPRLVASVFTTLSMAVSRVSLSPRGHGDKEFLAQDWFEKCLISEGIQPALQGRNSYPDYWLRVDGETNGFEIKSLSLKDGRPARKDLDFNSTIPSGKKDGFDVFLVFILHTGHEVHTLSVAHGDLINSDGALADAHDPVPTKGFGSEADGFIRNRKMYVFPHPITLDESGFGRSRLITPEDWGNFDARLTAVGQIHRRGRNFIVFEST